MHTYIHIYIHTCIRRTVTVVKAYVNSTRKNIMCTFIFTIHTYIVQGTSTRSQSRARGTVLPHCRSLWCVIGTATTTLEVRQSPIRTT